TYLVINNAFFSIVSQQHDKRVAFAASGWTSMRAYVNFQTLVGLFVVVPMATAVGAALGFLGGAPQGPFRRPPPPASSPRGLPPRPRAGGPPRAGGGDPAGGGRPPRPATSPSPRPTRSGRRRRTGR